MILVLPYSHKDIDQALRLVKWIGWLSFVNGHSMKKERIILVPSVAVSSRRIHAEICRIAARIFGEARSFTPSDEHETGWPGACNFMLKAALEHVELHFKDDMLLLEPDAIPTIPAWFDLMKDEWADARESGKEFLGNYVDYDIPHMTGIGIYGRNWRSVAPKLAVVQNERGWDTFAADEILPHAHITGLIQHIWRNPVISMDILKPITLIFHQDKKGKLIELLDEEHYDGSADRSVRYSQRFQVQTLPMHYFFNHNHNRVIRAQGLQLVSEPLDTIAGVWRGTFATEKEEEIIALQSLASDPKSGIRELTAEEYEGLTKKKAAPSLSSVAPPPFRPLEAKIDQSPAVLVVEPAAKGDPEAPAGPVVKDIDDVLKIGKVKLPETATDPLKRSKKGKKS